MACSCDCPTVQKEIHYEKHDNCPDIEFVIMSIKTMVPMKMDCPGAAEVVSIEKRVQALETALQQTIMGANAVATEQRQTYEKIKQSKKCEEEIRKREQQKSACADQQAALSTVSVPSTSQRKQWEQPVQCPPASRGVLPNWANKTARATPIQTQATQCQQPPATRIPQRTTPMPTRAPVMPAGNVDTTAKPRWRSGGPTGGAQSCFGFSGSAPPMIPRPTATINASLMRPQKNIQSASHSRAATWKLGTPAASSTMVSGRPSGPGNRTLEDLVAGFNNMEDSALSIVEISSIEHKTFNDFNDSMVLSSTK